MTKYHAETTRQEKRERFVSNLRCDECSKEITDYQPDLTAYNEAGMCDRCFEREARASIFHEGTIQESWIS